jgi:hypothetical protein
MADEFKMEGLAELQAFLQELPARVESNIMRGAIRAGAKPVADEARQLAPSLKDPDPRRTAGALKKSVRVMSVRSRGGVVQGGVAVGGRVKLGRGNKRQEADAFYAHMVERGTAKMGAQPFFRPAIDGKVQAAIDATANYIRQRIAAGALKK